MSAQTSKFRDIVELGKGGMGDVVLTVAPGPAGFNKLLVVKRLRDSLASDPEFLRMFLNEARLAARLNHPNIVHTYEVGFDGAHHYIAMEYLDGQCLQRIVRRTASAESFSLEMQLRVLADALNGLHYAHELTDYDGKPLAIVHRDISPANIFVLYDGQVKLVDFGIAKSANGTETKAGIFKGKIQYVSPEQYMGNELDRRADIYSAGVILWEAATRRRMWKDAGDLTVMQRVAGGDVPKPSSVNPDVPARLEAMCMKALAVSKEDRYPTAAAFQADIEDFLQELGSRVSARDVGALTGRTFAEERAHVKVLIEDQLRLVREVTDLPSLVPTVTLQPQDTVSRSIPPDVNLFPAFSPPPSRHKRRVALGLVASVVLLVGSWMVWPSAPATHAVASSTKSPVPADSVPPLAPVEPLASSTVAAAPAPQIKLTVQTVPKNARVSVDDAFLPANGELTGFPKDNALHKVRAEAPGFKAKAEWVRFDSNDVNVQLSLEPGPAKKGRKDGSSSAPGDLPSTPAGAGMNENDASARRRSPAPPIDSTDPWKR